VNKIYAGSIRRQLASLKNQDGKVIVLILDKNNMLPTLHDNVQKPLFLMQQSNCSNLELVKVMNNRLIP